MNLKNFFSIFLITVSLQDSAYTVGNDYAIEGEETPEQREARQQEEIEGFVRIFPRLPKPLKQEILRYCEQNEYEIAKEEPQCYKQGFLINKGGPTFIPGHSFYFPKNKRFIAIFFNNAYVIVRSSKMNLDQYKFIWEHHPYYQFNSFSDFEAIAGDQEFSLNLPFSGKDIHNVKIFSTSKPGSFLVYAKEEKKVGCAIYHVDLIRQKIEVLDGLTNFVNKNFLNMSSLDSFSLNLNKDGKLVSIVHKRLGTKYNVYLCNLEAGDITQTSFTPEQNEKERRPTFRACLNSEKTILAVLDEENRLIVHCRMNETTLADYFKSKGVYKNVLAKKDDSKEGFDSMEELLAYYETDPFPSQEKNDKPHLKRQKLLQ